MSLNIVITQKFIVTGCADTDSRYLVNPSKSPCAVAMLDPQGNQYRRGYHEVCHQYNKRHLRGGQLLQPRLHLKLYIVYSVDPTTYKPGII